MTKFYPKKFDAGKALKDWDQEYLQTFKTQQRTMTDLERGYRTGIETTLKWLAETIPAHEASITNIEFVQRINKYLSDAKK